MEIAPLVKSLVMQHSAVAERAGVRIVALVPPGRFANADELMLKRVLSNLLDNAIKFSPAGGSIVVALRQAVDGWRLQVRDAGIGIAHVEQIRIFDEFVQIDNQARDRRQGLGLGLAKSRFFAAVSHDLRQPVHAIGLYLEPLIALSHSAQDREAMRAIEGIRLSWRALDDLLSQVLDLTRMD